MLFRPVYIKAKKTEPPPVKIYRPPPPPPPKEIRREPTPPPPVIRIEQPPLEKSIPMLINRKNYRAIHPPEAARDVLSGKVAYIYVDDHGSTFFKPKHVFNALKLDRKKEINFIDYACVGAHERFLPQRPGRHLAHQRRYIEKYICPDDLLAKYHTRVMMQIGRY